MLFGLYDVKFQSLIFSPILIIFFIKYLILIWALNFLNFFIKVQLADLIFSYYFKYETILIQKTFY